MIKKIVVALILLNSLVYAADVEYWVDPNGDDGAAGTEIAPFKTIQYAVDQVDGEAESADTTYQITVNAGTYYEDVKISGFESSNATFLLTANGTVNIIGGYELSGFVAAPEEGSGIYKYVDGGTALGWVPEYMSSDGKHTIEITQSAMDDDSGYVYLNYANGSAYWNKVDVRWGYDGTNDNIYVRWEDGSDPDSKSVRFSKKTVNHSTILIYESSYVSVTGFNIVAAYYGLTLYDSDYNSIYNNTISGGMVSFYLYGDGVVTNNNNDIYNNTITLDHIYPDVGYHYLSDADDQNLYTTIKTYDTLFDRICILVQNTGSNNEIYNNTLTRCFDAIDVVDTAANFGTNLKVYNNNIYNNMDSAIEIDTEDGENQYYYDNVLHENTSSIRIKKVTTGPIYIYGNKVTQESGLGTGFKPSCTEEPETTGIVYVYHNTFATPEDSIYFNMTESTEALSGFWFINNILGSADIIGKATGFPEPACHTCYNYIAGDEEYGDDYWPLRHDNTGDLQNIEGTLNDLWTDLDTPDVDNPIDNTDLLEAGVDISQSFSCDGSAKSALPGFESGYFDLEAPDIGATQFGFGAEGGLGFLMINSFNTGSTSINMNGSGLTFSPNPQD
jgi:parallel beta-helix repeat protein